MKEWQPVLGEEGESEAKSSSLRQQRRALRILSVEKSTHSLASHSNGDEDADGDDECSDGPRVELTDSPAACASLVTALLAFTLINAVGEIICSGRRVD